MPLKLRWAYIPRISAPTKITVCNLTAKKSATWLQKINCIWNKLAVKHLEICTGYPLVGKSTAVNLQTTQKSANKLQISLQLHCKGISCIWNNHAVYCSSFADYTIVGKSSALTECLFEMQLILCSVFADLFAVICRLLESLQINCSWLNTCIVGIYTACCRQIDCSLFAVEPNIFWKNWGPVIEATDN